jgi:hypothetical protein
MLDYKWRAESGKKAASAQGEGLIPDLWGGCISFFPSWPLRSLRRGFFYKKIAKLPFLPQEFSRFLLTYHILLILYSKITRCSICLVGKGRDEC